MFRQQHFNNINNRDIKNSVDWAEEKGKLKEREKIALEMINNNEPINKIIQYTGLSKSDIENLTNKNNR